MDSDSHAELARRFLRVEDELELASERNGPRPRPSDKWIVLGTLAAAAIGGLIYLIVSIM